MKKILLSKGKYALVDDEDFEYLNQFKWYMVSGYAVRSIKVNGKWLFIKMHREIMNTPEGMDTDHIDGDGLNNQRINLRIATTSQNLFNSRIRSDNSSGIKGVHLDKKSNRWRAKIRVNTKLQIDLGSFGSKEEAGKARKEGEKKYHGEFTKEIS